MKCPRCGNEVEEGSNFCPHCGAPVSQHPENLGNGTSVERDSSFHPVNGSEDPGTLRVNGEAITPSADRKGFRPWIIVMAVVIFCLPFVGFFIGTILMQILHRKGGLSKEEIKLLSIATICSFAAAFVTFFIFFILASNGVLHTFQSLGSLPFRFF
jgi:hypothetical protein